MMDLGLKKVVNASGRMSILGVSTLSDEVVQAMKFGGQAYWEIADLVEKSGAKVAEHTKTESAVIVNSASAGIALSVAAVISRDKGHLAEKVHKVATNLGNEIIIPKGHNVNYGAPVETMVQLGGGTLREAGSANLCTVAHIEAEINPATAGILYIKSHHCVQKGILSLQQLSEVAKKHNIPLIIDAAAEESFAPYTELANLAIFSGSKAFEGPTSGIVAGGAQWIGYIKPHLKGIGRAMKVDKGAIFGLLQALAAYETKVDTSAKQQALIQQLMVLNDVDGVKVIVHQDEAGRAIFRGRVFIDESVIGKSALTIVSELMSGEIAIYPRDHYANVGFFEIDPRPLLEGDMELIVKKLQEIVGRK